MLKEDHIYSSKNVFSICVFTCSEFCSIATIATERVLRSELESIRGTLEQLTSWITLKCIRFFLLHMLRLSDCNFGVYHIAEFMIFLAGNLRSIFCYFSPIHSRLISQSMTHGYYSPFIYQPFSLLSQDQFYFSEIRRLLRSRFIEQLWLSREVTLLPLKPF